MTTAPPALSANPQFTPEFWEKVPREKHKVKLTRITKLGEDHTEFVFEDDSAFARRTDELDPDIKLHVNLVVFVETIRDQLVTGMWVPEQGWAFRMTAEQLAEHTRKLASAQYERRQQAMGKLRDYVRFALADGITDQGADFTDMEDGKVAIGSPIDLDELSRFVLKALEDAKSAGAR